MDVDFQLSEICGTCELGIVKGHPQLSLTVRWSELPIWHLYVYVDQSLHVLNVTAIQRYM
jgi:hypothetical protein